MKAIAETTGGIAMMGVYMSLIACYFNGLLTAFNEGSFLWFMFNMIMPMGIITGFLDFVA